MEDIQTFIGYPCNKSNEIVLASEEDEKRNLRYRKPSGTYTKGGVVLPTRHVVVDELKSQDESKIGQKDKGCAKRWNLPPEGLSDRRDLWIRDFAEDGCDCG